MKSISFLAALLVLAVESAALLPLEEIASMPLNKRQTGVWSVIVAGSNGYNNYRHQADVCHMFHSLRKLGVPEEHIIVFMYDDIANNKENPSKGRIINTSPNGVDVYQGVPKDYTGELVSSSNFLEILTGGVPQGGSGKRLKSTANDHVFVYFSDHGDPGSLCFPNNVCDLSSEKLLKSLSDMHTAGLYGKLLFYIEACFSGSLFYDTKAYPPNAYFWTAAPPYTSSYAWMFDDSANALVSDKWSWYVLDFMDNKPSGTLEDQFNYTDAAVNFTSPSCQYGDLQIPFEYTLTEYFMGTKSLHKVKGAARSAKAVPAWSAPLETARQRFLAHPSQEAYSQLQKELRVKDKVDQMARSIMNSFGISILNRPPKCFDHLRVITCFRKLSKVFRQECGQPHDYFLSVYPLFHEICSSAAVNEGTSSVEKFLVAQCSQFSL